MQAETPDPSARRDALASRLLDATLGLMDLAAVYMGDRLGFYRALHHRGPLTSTQLAAETRTTERYEIRGLPTLIVFRGAEPAERRVGLMSREDVGRLLERHR